MATRRKKQVGVPRHWSWSRRNVSPSGEHFELRYGSADSDPKTWVLVARLGRPIDNEFGVDFVVDTANSANGEMVTNVIRELDFFLVDKIPLDDPWLYAKYHCGTSANLYSSVHWSFHADSGSGQVPQRQTTPSPLHWSMRNLTNSCALDIMQEWETQISDPSRRRKLLYASDWVHSIPALGGVYIIWENINGKAVYIGETCHLQHRLSDMVRSGHHGFVKRIRARPEMQNLDELQFASALADNFSFSFLVLALGRVEFEEYLLFRWHDTVRNKKPGRFKYRQDIEEWICLNQHNRTECNG